MWERFWKKDYQVKMLNVRLRSVLLLREEYLCETFPLLPTQKETMNYSPFNCSFYIFAGLALLMGLSSCSEFAEEAAGPKIYAPGEIRAEDIERIAMSEAGLREGVEINYRSRGVTDRGDTYYVSLVARPYRPGATRTVGVNSRGEIVDYIKGDRIPPAGKKSAGTQINAAPSPGLLSPPPVQEN